MLRALATVVGFVLLNVVAAPAHAVESAQTADLKLTKTSTYNTVKVGGLVTYTVTVTNRGPADATNVQFGDPMPDQLNLVYSTCGNVSATCTVALLPAGASTTLTILATPITNLAASERKISNTAFISHSDTTDPNPGNDQASDVVTVVGSLRPCSEATRLCIAPSRIQFGSRPVGTETLQGVTLTNVGPRSLRVHVDSALPDDFGFGLMPGSTCPAFSPGEVLAPLESCRAVVRFSPSEFFAGDPQEGSLTVTLRHPVTNAVINTRTIKVIGRGVAP
jgi:uncharacterized repeat protein (TIGR01451 family)